MPVDIRDEIRKTLSYVIPGYKFTPAYKYAVQAGRKWDGSKTVALLNKGGVPGLTIPTGLASYAREILAAKSVPYEISDERLVTVPDPGWSTSGLIMRDYQLPIVESALKRQRGVIKSSTGCHEAGQGILMHDGSTKLVEDIVVGDKLMGPDSLPRVVQGLIRGRGQMYKINPVKGKPFVVNDEHVLSLSITCGRSYRVHSKTNQVGRRRPPQQFVDVPLNEWLTWKPHLKHVYKLYRVPTSWGKKHLPIKPYVLGALIGDGSLLHTVSLCSMDKEIASEFKKESERLGMKCDEYHNNNSVNKSSMYYARVIVKGSKNTFKEILREIGLFGKTSGDKFIPFDYKTSDQSDRLEILAGLMDTDGNLSNGVYDFVSKSRQLADDVAFVARSVGLAAYVKPTYKYCQTGMGGEYFRVTISGHTSIIPCRITRKKCSTRKQKKNVLRTGFSAEKIGLGNFFGFTVNGDGRYLLDDFTVTHNSGKTEVVVKIMVEAACFPAIFYVTSCDLLLQAKDRFSRYVTHNGLPARIGQIGAGQCDIQPITIATVQSCERVLTGKYTKYTYDDCSSDDKTEFSDSQKNDIRGMVKDAKFVYVDECFDYYTRVLLPNGKSKNIGALVNEKFDGEVVSFNRTTMKFEPKKVIGWVRKKPDRPIVRIRLGNVSGLRCSDNHVFYTLRGPIEAGSLKRGDAVISSLTDNRSSQALSEEGQQVVLGSSLGDGCLQLGGKRSVGARFVTNHCAEQEGYLRYKYSFLGKLASHISLSSKSGYTGRSEVRGITFSSPQLSQLMGIPRHERVAKLGWLGLAMWYFDDGSLNKRNFCGTIALCSASDETATALVDKLAGLGVRSKIYHTKKGKILFISTKPMKIFASNIARYCPPCMLYKLPPEFRNEPLHVPQECPNYGFISVVCASPSSVSKRSYKNERDVYCLTVEDNHNFVAGGCVVKNCQHVSCETIQSILNESHAARFRFGGSASPWRDDGLDLLIEACFGRRVCDVTASFLINSGYLLKPFITFNHFNQSLGDFGTFNAHYESFIADNVARNQWIAERTNYHVSQGRPTIVLVKWVKHAEKLQSMIPGSEILCSSGDAKKSPKKRKEFLDAMRERKLMCIIGTSLMDEGVDVPAAGAGIFAGGGKSSTRELQRVGRFIRPDPADPEKKCAYIEEFYDHSKWLRNHAKLRRKILETEPAFEISDNNISLSL